MTTPARSNRTLLLTSLAVVAVAALVAGATITITSYVSLQAALTEATAAAVDFYSAQALLSIGVGILVAGVVSLAITFAAFALAPRGTSDAELLLAELAADDAAEDTEDTAVFIAEQEHAAPAVVSEPAPAPAQPAEQPTEQPAGDDTTRPAGN